MSVANVGSRWEEGNLVFFSKLTGQKILIFDAENNKLEIPEGSGIDTDGDAIAVTEPDGETIEVKDKKLQTKGVTDDIEVADGDGDTITITVVNGLITKIQDGE